MLVVATQAKGSVLIHQKMFESRLFFVDKLIDMGAPVSYTHLDVYKRQALAIRLSMTSGASVPRPSNRQRNSSTEGG